MRTSFRFANLQLPRIFMMAGVVLWFFLGSCATLSLASPPDTSLLRLLVPQEADVKGEGSETVAQVAVDLRREVKEALVNKGFKVVSSPDKPFDVEIKLVVETEVSYAVVNAWVLFKKSTLLLVQDEQVLLRVDYVSDARGGKFKTYGKEGEQYAKDAAAALVGKMMNAPSFASIARNARGNSSSPLQSQAYEGSRTGRETSSPSTAGLSDVDRLPAGTVKTRKDAFAIVIGIEEYRQKLPHADFAANDARTVANYLINVLGYPEENVVMLINERALKSDMEKYFEQWLANNVEPQSSVFIYYSGHGAPDPKTGGAFLVPYDGDPTFIKQTGYPLKKVYDVLNKLQNRETIVALDSCFSGAGGRSVLAKGARPLVMNLQTSAPLSKGVVVMSASNGDQVSSTYDDKGHGLFTYFLLKGLKEEDVINKDGSLKIQELFSYVKPQVSRISRKMYNNEQTPQLFEGKKSADD